MLLPPERAGLTEADGEFRRSILEQLNVQVWIVAADIGEVFTDVRCDLWAIITTHPRNSSRNRPQFNYDFEALTNRQQKRLDNRQAPSN